LSKSGQSSALWREPAGDTKPLPTQSRYRSSEGAAPDNSDMARN